MEAPSNLETNGNLQINPFAELLAEISQIKLNGSLRVAHETQKISVYFDAGEVVFAASNVRQHRLFEMLRQTGKVTAEQLTAIPEFTNDLILRDHLLKNEAFTSEEFDSLFSGQIIEVLKTALVWRSGDWSFSPLVRIKDGIRLTINLPNLLLEHTRNLPTVETARKLSNPQESFDAKAVLATDIILSPRESFVFSRFGNAASTIEEIQTISGLPDLETRQIIYTLWLGGLLVRKNWNAAFSERKIAAISAARISIRKAAPPPIVQPPAISEMPIAVEEEESEATVEVLPNEKVISLEDYIERVEKADNFYDIFALPPEAPATEIKKAYFGLAKRFHPDLYHREADLTLLQRVETAFTKLAQAYDTLKDADSRELYDFKARKELAEIKAVQNAETTFEEIDTQKQTDQAAESFERGFSLLMDGNSLGAIPFIARAVHYTKNNARYHAYYGKALSADNKQRHKAESELQTAVKLDGENADYRIMLAEFFISFNLLKRAEGELNRLLTIFPNHREAKLMLDSLPKK